MSVQIDGPRHEVARLSHVELLSPRPAETVAFFCDLLGMEVSARDGQSVYLRAYEEFAHHSLKVTEAAEAGLGHVAWRADSPQALQRRAAALEACGAGRGWSDGDHGHGPAYRFEGPDGHRMELLWEVEPAAIAAEDRSPLKNRPQKRPTRGVPVRRIDHVNLMASDVRATAEFAQRELGFRLNEMMHTDGTWLAAFLAVTNLAHDIGLFADPSGSRGRLHHVAFWYGFPQHLYDASEILKEAGIEIEAGPSRHGISQGMFLYVYEPGGNRVELFGDCGYLIWDPDWETVVWDLAEVPGVADAWVGQVIPECFYVYGTPAVAPVVA